MRSALISVLPYPSNQLNEQVIAFAALHPADAVQRRLPPGPGDRNRTLRVAHEVSRVNVFDWAL